MTITLIECSYTKDKIKKRKKFIDGFIKIITNVNVNSTIKRLILYGEDKVKIFTTTSFKIDNDDYISTSVYLIYVDEPHSLIEGGIIKNEEPIEEKEEEVKNIKMTMENKKMVEEKKGTVEESKVLEIVDEETDEEINKKYPSTTVRSNEEILRMFKK